MRNQPCPETSDVYYLAKLTKTEFKSVNTILKKYSLRGYLGVALDIAEFNMGSLLVTAHERERAERIARELRALIERMDGFEELEAPLHA